MNDLIPFLVVGTVSGSVYGLAGLGLVLTYKTTGVFNFAHGGIAALAAYFFYDLHTRAGLPWPVAALISVVGFGAVSGFLLERMTRSLARSRPILTIVATVGLLLATQGFLTVVYGAATLEFPSYLPEGTVQVDIVAVSYEQICIAAVGAVAAVGLLLTFRLTRLGLAMRAVVDDPDLLSLAAVPPRKVRTASWMIGCSFAALSGVLIAPLLGRDPILLTLLIVQAFGAAAIGRFSSLPGTYLGGIGVGIAVALTTKWVASEPNLIGLPPSLPFLILVVALLVTPTRHLRKRAVGVSVRSPRPPAAWSNRQRLVGALVLVGVVYFLPELVGTKMPVFLGGVVLLPMFLSLALLLWTSGQISLGHAAFVALGASTFSHALGAGFPWLLALLVAGLAVVPLGALVALTAIRVSGIYLALATFGFGLLMQRLIYSTSFMFGDSGARSATRPKFLGIDGDDDRVYFFVVVAVTVACFATVAWVQRGRLGRVLRGLGDSPTALSSLGADANVARVLVFCIAGFLAGISGALSISATNSVSVDSFGLNQSLLWITVLALCGTRLMVGPVLAALMIALSAGYLPDDLLEAQPLMFGVAAVIMAITIDRRYDVDRRSRGRGQRSPAARRGRLELPGPLGARPAERVREEARV